MSFLMMFLSTMHVGSSCPDAVYRVQILCWHPDPQYRPSFKSLRCVLVPCTEETCRLQHTFTQHEVVQRAIGDSLYGEIKKNIRDVKGNEEYAYCSPSKPTTSSYASVIKRSEGLNELQINCLACIAMNVYINHTPFCF
eukprot:m.127864 g.127864  ORF g.127864 m.127864 type:complete len:139 (+) comp9445_c0_seq12:157-573(+)